MVDIRRSFIPLDEADIAAIEQELAVQLPPDYRAFLLESNGGRPASNVFTYTRPDGPTAGIVDWFLGIHTGDNESLRRYVRRYKGRMPANLLPIAEDPFGNIICLAVTGDDTGRVYFWDHEYEASEGEPPATDNVYRIADSFSAFLASLKS